MTVSPVAFPAAATAARFEDIEKAELLPAVTALVAGLGHPGTPVSGFEDGSLPVYAVGEDLVLKLFPPVYADESRVESGVLRALDGRLEIPTPEVRAVGERDGWTYVLMSRLPGEPLSGAWPRLSTSDRDVMADRLGRTLARLHATCKGLPGLAPANWSSWIAGQRERAVERQRSLGLDEQWLRQIPGFLASVPLGDPEPVLLHTECMAEHLMVERADGGLRLSGLFDFESSMLGAPEYEFVGVGIFVAGGDARFLRRLLLSYGYRPGELGEEFARRLLAYTLLHRFSHLPWYLSVMPAPPEPTLDALARAWWPTGSTAPDDVPPPENDRQPART